MKRSPQNLSFTRLLTLNQGQLVPIGCVEVLPGDTFKHHAQLLIRTSPLKAPVMHPVHARVHHWFVPTRLLWESWEDFITGGADGNDASSFPTKTWTGANLVNAGKGSLNNHLGIPPLTTGTHTISALPLRAYSLIFNEWYRDQDLQSERVISLADGADSTTDVTLAKVNWEKDYLTTARPWAQKGAAVTIPVERISDAGSWTAYLGNTDTAAPDNPVVIGSPPAGTVAVTGAGGVSFDPSGGLVISPDDLRLGMALQRYKEARAQYGSRYTEYLRYLGVRSSDARLQRPEYLGGGQETVQFSEVLQTAPETDAGTSETPGVGNLKGHGIGSLRSNKYLRFFEEHGFVISLLSVKPRTMYTQCIPRMYNRRTKEDYWQKELQFVGQQQLLNKEVYAYHSSPDGGFGFQDRYDEYRSQMSQVSGEFSPGGNLTYWHMGRIFTSDPALNSLFVEANPTDRIYAEESSTEGQQLQVMCSHKLFARRMVAQNGGKNHVY